MFVSTLSKPLSKNPRSTFRQTRVFAPTAPEIRKFNFSLNWTPQTYSFPPFRFQKSRRLASVPNAVLPPSLHPPPIPPRRKPLIVPEGVGAEGKTQVNDALQEPDHHEHQGEAPHHARADQGHGSRPPSAKAVSDAQGFVDPRSAFCCIDADAVLKAVWVLGGGVWAVRAVPGCRGLRTG